MKNKLLKTMDPIQLGEYFGYPPCCIADFLSSMLSFMQGEPDTRSPRKLRGTGYIPCPECNKKSEEELLAVIKANRKHLTPFPFDTEGRYDKKKYR